MKRKRLLTLLGSVCLALMLALPLVAGACAKAAPEGAAEEEIAALEAEIDELEGDVTAKDVEISDLEAEIAELRAPAKIYKLRLQSAVSSDGICAQVFVSHFQPALEELSQGQIEVTRFDAGVLVPTMEMLDAVRSKTVDMATTSGGYTSGTVGPAAEFWGGGPFTWETFSDWSTLNYDLGLEDVARRAYAPHGVYLIGCLLDTPGANIFSTVPIESRNDFVGLKIRCYGLTAELLEKLGASTVYFPWEEIYTGMATGVIDAATCGDASFDYRAGLYEVFDYWVEPTFNQVVDDLIINPDLWAELPDNLKAALTYSTRTWSDAKSRLYQYEGTAALLKMVNEHGIIVNELPSAEEAEIRRLAVEIWDEVAGDDPLAQEVVEILKDYLEHTGR